MKLNDNKLSKVNGGTTSSRSVDKDCKCLKCGSTFKVTLKPYICPRCGELKEGEYSISSTDEREVFVA